MNITEFAQFAGVSKSAVSRYFNDGYLSEDKKEKIRKAIEETGYSPSLQAQTMRTHKTRLIGVILPKLSSESCARVTEGISEVLNEEGYQLLLVNTDNNPQKEVEFLELFKQNRVDGVIFLASIFTPLHKAVLKSMHIPVIIVGQQYRGFNCVCHDDYGASYALTSLMLEKGCIRPAYIGVTIKDTSAGLARREGFLNALKDHSFVPRPQYMCIAEFTIDSGYNQAGVLLNKEKIPDCIFCATDNIAIGAMQYCRENNIIIPDDIIISAVGDTKIGRAASIPLTSAHLHYRTSGNEAAHMLLKTLKSNDSVTHIIKLDYDIIERKSTYK